MTHSIPKLQGYIWFLCSSEYLYKGVLLQWKREEGNTAMTFLLDFYILSKMIFIILKEAVKQIMHFDSYTNSVHSL